MPSKFNILLYEPIHREGLRVLENKCRIAYAESFDEQDLVEQTSAVDAIIIRGYGVISKKIIQSAARLKVIGKHGAGLDKIDLRAAKAHGIPVVYTPMANAQGVAELFVGLALKLFRKLRFAEKILREGRWAIRPDLTGLELCGKRLGILGFGNAGQKTAAVCRRGFGMSALYYDVVDYPEMGKELNARRVSLEEVFAQSDLISINLPLLSTTRGLVDATLLKLMKPTAFIINMSRGPIWKEADVVSALRENWIAGAGSDVYEIEPSPSENPLFQFDNFVGTPHMGAYTEESMIRMSLVTRDVLAVLEGQTPQFPVPEKLYA